LGETDPVILGTAQPGENSLGRIKVAIGWIVVVVVMGEQAHQDREFGPGIEGQPVKPSNKVLVGHNKRLFGFDGTKVVRDTIDDKAGAVGICTPLYSGVAQFWRSG
jgi:hypothetical protein